MILLLAATLRLQQLGLKNLHAQRKADRCWHLVLSERCGRLSTLSTLNQRLKELAPTAAAAKALMAVPGAGAVAKTTYEVMKAAAQAIEWAQNRLLQADQAWVVLGPSLCGKPRGTPRALSALMERRPTTASAVAALPAPLAWTRSPTESVVVLRSRQGPWTGGQCASAQREELSGEPYSATLRIRGTSSGAKPWLRASSSWPSWLLRGAP